MPRLSLCVCVCAIKADGVLQYRLREREADRKREIENNMNFNGVMCDNVNDIKYKSKWKNESFFLCVHGDHFKWSAFMYTRFILSDFNFSYW